MQHIVSHLKVNQGSMGIVWGEHCEPCGRRRLLAYIEDNPRNSGMWICESCIKRICPKKPPPKIKMWQYIRQTKIDNPHLNSQQISEQILKDSGLMITRDYVRSALSRLRRGVRT